MPFKYAQYIDLHIHSTASDGSLSPVQIIQAAKQSGLRAIAITDHDTLEGSIEALAFSESFLEIIPGIEISAQFSPGSMHILGYLMQTDNPSLRQTLRLLQKARAERNLRIVEKLKNLGLAFHYRELLDLAGGGQIGRPHFARALVRKGTVKDVDEAFDKYLKQGRAAYVSKYRLQPAEAIASIARAGGVPVLAHPCSLQATNEAALEKIVLDLKAVGLQGIEVYYPSHDADTMAIYEHLAHRHGMVMTGGTDYHGAAKPDIRLGVGKGDLRIPYRLVEGLKACKAQSH